MNLPHFFPAFSRTLPAMAVALAAAGACPQSCGREGTPPWPFAANTQPSPGQIECATAAGREIARTLAALADLPLPAPGAFEPWLFNSLLLVSILAACFWGWNQSREALAREPSFEKQIERMAGRLDNLEKVVIGSATKVEMQALEKQLARDFSESIRTLEARRSADARELHRDIAANNAEAAQRAAAIHERINALAEEMPGKILRLLKVTGHLGRKDGAR